MWYTETKRVWVKRGSATLAALDALIARGGRRVEPWGPWEAGEPQPVWDEPPRSPRSPAYRPERPERPVGPVGPDPVDDEEMNAMD